MATPAVVPPTQPLGEPSPASKDVSKVDKKKKTKEKKDSIQKEDEQRSYINRRRGLRSSGRTTETDILLCILAIFVPPLAVWLATERGGVTIMTLLVWILTLFLIPFASIMAICIILSKNSSPRRPVVQNPSYPNGDLHSSPIVQNPGYPKGDLHSSSVVEPLNQPPKLVRNMPTDSAKNTPKGHDWIECSKEQHTKKGTDGRAAGSAHIMPRTMETVHLTPKDYNKRMNAA